MAVVFIALGLLTLMFGLAAVWGAPFLPTHKKTVTVALDLLDLKPGQTLLDIGSGSGTVMLAAARRGLRSIGLELNPLLYLISYLRLIRYRGLTELKLVNYWHHQLPEADGVYVFLIDRYMKKLDRKVKNEINKPIFLISNSFKIPGKKEVKTTSGLYLYRYP